MKMAKYTTEVRTICEYEAGYDEEKGFSQVDSILNNSWNKIFTTQCSFFDNNYRSVLCKKILKHYYTREIGAETVGLWKLWMNTKLEEIMPYYNKLYESELIQFNPMQNVNLTKTKDIAGTERGSESGSDSREIVSEDGGTRTDTLVTSSQGSGSSSGSVSTDRSGTNGDTTAESSTNRNAFSDTPQSTLDNVDNLRYLTDYRKITEGKNINVNGTNSEEEDTSTSGQYSDSKSGRDTNTINYGKTNETTNGGTHSKTNSLDTTEEYLETLVGNSGSWNYSRLLLDFRDTFLNIDMMVINEFKNLFMQVW